MKTNHFLLALGVVLPFTANADCLERAAGYSDYTSPGNNPDNLPGVRAAFVDDGVIEVKELSNNFTQSMHQASWNVDYGGLVETNASCILINQEADQNTYRHMVSGPPREVSGVVGPFTKLMKCEASRGIGAYSITNNPATGFRAGLFNFNVENSNYHHGAYGELIDLNDYVLPGELGTSTNGYDAQLVRADDIRDDQILVWAGWPAGLFENVAGHRYSLYVMNLDECGVEPPPPPPNGEPQFIHVEAEDYDRNYDINHIVTETWPDGVTNLAHIENTEWVDYDFQIVQSGTYTLRFRFASWEQGRAITVYASGGDGQTIVDFPVTGYYNSWQTLEVPLTLSSQDTKTIRFTFMGEMNVDWFELELN